MGLNGVCVCVLHECKFSWNKSSIFLKRLRLRLTLSHTPDLLTRGTTSQNLRVSSVDLCIVLLSAVCLWVSLLDTVGKIVVLSNILIKHT